MVTELTGFKALFCWGV